MKNIKKKLIVALTVILSLTTFADFVLAQQDLFPWVRYSGGFQTTAGIGTGSLNLNAFITEADYENGDVWNANVTGIETIIGARVMLSGATRTGDYSFNGVPEAPPTLSIKTFDGAYTYLQATLSEVTFECGIVMPVICWLNKELDANDPSTLNLIDIALGTNDGGSGPYPSRYIDELAAYLAASNASGLKMSLLVPPVSIFDFTANSSGPITYGLIDGLQSLNAPPLANAGDNITISSEAVDITTVTGIATDGDIGDALQYRWMEGEAVLQDWAPVIDENECPIDLINIAPLAIGQHILTLLVSDGQADSSDDMLLTIANSAPHAAPGAGGVHEAGADVMLAGDISDYDGDLLHYEWTGSGVICEGDIQVTPEGTPVELPVCIISGLSVGEHTFNLTANDGFNSPDFQSIIVKVVDTTEPTIAPEANKYLLWPPNHVMVDMVIVANASDNSGLPALSASITSNEPEEGLGDGDTGPYDYTTPVIDQNTGEIYFQLRRERSGSGNGRIYTVTVTATDDSGNFNEATIEFPVPHDMRKK